MNMPIFCKTSCLRVLIASYLALGLGMGVAVAADTTAMLQAHSGCVCAVITDTAITAKIKAKRMGQEIFKKSDIEVTTTNGVVKLEGSASSAQAKSVAENLLRSVEGVRSVNTSGLAFTSN